MNKRLVFFLEEESMYDLLSILLPRLLPPQINFKLIPHEGKQDLEKNISGKLMRWKTPTDLFCSLALSKQRRLCKIKTTLKSVMYSSRQARYPYTHCLP